jgi:hypothetical protein
LAEVRKQVAELMQSEREAVAALTVSQQNQKALISDRAELMQSERAAVAALAVSQENQKALINEMTQLRKTLETVLPQRGKGPLPKPPASKPPAEDPFAPRSSRK